MTTEKATWVPIKATAPALVAALGTLADANAIAKSAREDADRMARKALIDAGVKAPKGSEIVFSHRFGFAYAIVPVKAKAAGNGKGVTL